MEDADYAADEAQAQRDYCEAVKVDVLLGAAAVAVLLRLSKLCEWVPWAVGHETVQDSWLGARAPVSDEAGFLDLSIAFARRTAGAACPLDEEVVPHLRRARVGDH